MGRVTGPVGHPEESQVSEHPDEPRAAEIDPSTDEEAGEQSTPDDAEAALAATPEGTADDGDQVVQREPATSTDDDTN